MVRSSILRFFCVLGAPLLRKSLKILKEINVSAREARRFSVVLGTGNTKINGNQAKSTDSDPGPVELIARIGKEFFYAIPESD